MTFKFFVDLGGVCCPQMSPTYRLEGSTRYISILDMFRTTDINTQDRLHRPFPNLFFTQRILPGVVMNELNTVLLTLYQEWFKRTIVFAYTMRRKISTEIDFIFSRIINILKIKLFRKNVCCPTKIELIIILNPILRMSVKNLNSTIFLWLKICTWTNFLNLCFI